MSKLPIPEELVDILCTGTDSQIDASLKPRLQALKHRTDDLVKDELRGIIGDCIAYDLCSGFVLSALQVAIYVGVCGGKLEDVTPVISVRPWN